MTKHLSIQDFEILSAYLDGELTAQEQSHLEQSLSQRNDLQQGLEELRRTRIILRSAPRLHSPRNFTLTAQMVGGIKPVRRPFFAFNALRFSSALATLLLVFSVVGEWLTFSGPAAAPVAMLNEPTAAAVSQAPETALLLEAPAESTELSQDLSPVPSAKGQSEPEMTPMPTGEELFLAQPAIEATPGEPSALESPMMGAAMLAETPTMEAAPMDNTPAATETPAIEAFNAVETPPSESARTLVQPTPALEAAAGAREAGAVQPAAPESTINPHIPWRLSQGFLLTLALLSAGGAIVLRKNNRSRPR